MLGPRGVGSEMHLMALAWSVMLKLVVCGTGQAAMLNFVEFPSFIFTLCVCMGVRVCAFSLCSCDIRKVAISGDRQIDISTVTNAVS